MSGALHIPSERLPAPGGRSLFHHDKGIVLLFDVEGCLYAIDDRCPHAGASLFSGRLDGRWLQCPAHGLKFNLDTGCPAGLKGFGVRRYPIEWRADECFLLLDEGIAEGACA
ncbi:Rieske (2Fe-2S) protein [Pseudomonas sp. LA21]|uniref:Rieske (2Fe-2S) protein n=1 Tax=unclassified Pseudomonas TaxID=196821 RepID=UPI001FB5C360|nr:Rieske (2Fe-2S) protein [Pseudomonas sp. LA21]MCJ1887135.1 Rieske (2Fe-2S) protein [Pseudomonas sp. LA21]